MSTAVALAMASFATTGVIAYGFGAYRLAQSKTFFTAPREGTAEFVMRGNAVDRMIVVWQGRRARGIPLPGQPYSEYDIIDNETTSADEKSRPLGGRHYLNPINWPEPLGIYWIGLAPFYHIHHYDFVWTEERRDDTGKILPKTRYAIEGEDARNEGQTSFIYLKDANYFFVVDDVKTSDGVPLRFVILVTVRVINPYKALFQGTHWIQRMGTAISDMVVRYAGQLSYEAIMASKPTHVRTKDGNGMSDEKSLEEFIVMLGDGKADNLVDGDLATDYGALIVAAKRHEVDFSLDQAREDYRTATTARYVGEQTGLAEQARARGEADAIRIRAQAEKDRIDLVYSAIDGGDVEKHMDIRRMEALEKSGSEGGNTIVIPDVLAGLGRLFGANRKP